nr:e3 sumo-protein ligase siz2 [Quercus suber]
MLVHVEETGVRHHTQSPRGETMIGFLLGRWHRSEWSEKDQARTCVEKRSADRAPAVLVVEDQGPAQEQGIRPPSTSLRSSPSTNQPTHSPIPWLSHAQSSPAIANPHRRLSSQQPRDARLAATSPVPTSYPWQSSPVPARPPLPSSAASDDNVTRPRRVAPTSASSHSVQPSAIPHAWTPAQSSIFPGLWTHPVQPVPSQSIPNIPPQPGLGPLLTDFAQRRQSRPAVLPPPVFPSQAKRPRQSPGRMQQDAGTIPATIHLQPRPSPCYSIPFERTQLRNAVDARATQHQIQAQGQPGYHTGQGRLSLLKEAVEQDDMFFLVLSQLTCLRSMSAKTLPRRFGEIPQSCFDSLDQLLSSNASLRPDLISYLASFPQPMVYFYSNPGIRGLQELYDAVLDAVCTFLCSLGPNWAIMKKDCNVWGSPPLVQDMQRRLALFSPGLQSVVFRAASRELLLPCHNEHLGISSLEIMHRLDQDMVRQGLMRNEQALQQGRTCLRLLILRYRDYESSYVTSGNAPPFQIPGEYLTMFRDVNNSGVSQGNPSIIVPRSGSYRSTRPQSSQVRQHYAPNPVQAQHRIMSSTSTQDARGVSFFFPRPGAPPPAFPSDPHTARIGLHHSHLRSPEPVSRETAVVSDKLYRQVSGFEFWPPWKLHPNSIRQHATFTVSAKERDRTAQTILLNGASGPQRTTDPHSLTWRLRCTQFVDTSDAPDESSWLEADSVWPDDTYFFIGEDLQPLEVRKKLHHGRYLPVDLTSHIRPGSNKITVVINRNNSNRSKPYEYALAVEKVEIISHQYILDNIPDVDDQTSLGHITDSLKSQPSADRNPGDDDEDDVMIMTTSVNLNVRNPHTLLLVDIPVRSTRCKHFDCFDLPTYLLAAKRDDPAWPSKADTWRCPICRGDARPSLLVKDGFFARVGRELHDRGETDVDSIVVEADGQWRVRARDATTGVRSASLDRGTAELAAAAAASIGRDVGAPKGKEKEKEKERVIIELDDD